MLLTYLFIVNSVFIILNVVGLASVAKVLLAFKYEELPPNLHFRQANTKIPSLHDGQLQVVDSRTPFHGTTVAINSFGFGGENVHAVVKKYEGPRKQRSGQPLPVNGRDSAIEMRDMDRGNQNQAVGPRSGRVEPINEQLRLLAVSARTEDGAKTALQITVEHNNSPEVLAMMVPQMDVPVSIMPARCYIVMKGQEEVSKDTRVGMTR